MLAGGLVPVKNLKILLGLVFACPCWWQLVSSDYGEDAKVLNSVT